MFGLPLAFASPFVLLALLALPAIWWLLRLMPPSPQQQAFPPTRLLAEIGKKEDTPNTSPWWLTLLRLVLTAAVIIALSGPFLQPQNTNIATSNPLVLVVDNGWTSAEDWNERKETAQAILDEAARAGRPTALVMTTDPENAEIRLAEPEEAIERLRAQSPAAFPEDRETTADRFNANAGNLEGSDVIWLASPLATAGDETFADAISAIATPNIRYTSATRFAITGVENGAAAMNVTVSSLSGSSGDLLLKAYDEDNLSLVDTPLLIDGTEVETEATITLPIELRNQIARLEITDANGDSLNSVGVNYLLDDRLRRRTVGLLSGVSADLAQPLLSQLHYIQRALEPFADIREAGTVNVATAIPALLQSGVSMIVMADVGTIPETQSDRLRGFIERGGTVVRFAGPRLAAASDTLTPVQLREGERNLGGSLTWERPQKVARFSPNGPFAGMDLPDDIEVRRQVLAEPDFDLLQKTWVELEDGTPLVTAEQIGDGWLVLFHVTADATWSNLPISGAFVDMLVKLVAFSSVPASALVENQGSEDQILSPFQSLDAYGNLVAPLDTAEPISLSDLDTVTASRIAPPGLYGKSEALVAHNLMREDTPFMRLDPQSLFPDSSVTAFGERAATDLRPWFFTIAVLLLLADGVIVAFMAGLFTSNPLTRFARSTSAVLAALAVSAALFLPSPVKAQAEVDDDIVFDATLTTRLAYVETGDPVLDEISLAGMRGLTNFLTLRTALEPGPPIGVDISTDELAFYALLYWPVSENSPIPSSETMARVDAFMKQGGTVLFDTRDQIDAGFNSVTPANLRLREIVASLDIPPLEPVPPNHVLTRAFYLLQDFPGRWIGSPLWVEATENNHEPTEESLSRADGVSSILITANDFAGAWAIDEGDRPLLPTVPSDPTQRVYAFRTGVNIVMYTLTGNYKADQVHIPALLERLGQ